MGFSSPLSAACLLMVECLFKINQLALTFIVKKLNAAIFREKTITTYRGLIAAKNVVCRKTIRFVYFIIQDENDCRQLFNLYRQDYEHLPS